MVWEYYRAAIPRVFFDAVEWAIGQGWLLTSVLACGVFFASVFFAVYRGIRGKNSWGEAMNDLVQAVKDFLFSLVLGSAIALILLFAVFFVKDGPEQLDIAQKQARDAKSKYDLVVSPANLKVISGGFAPVPGSALFYMHIDIFNLGADVASNLRLKIYYMNRNYVILNTVPFNVSNEITSKAGYVITNDPQYLPINEGVKFFAIAYVYEDMVSLKKYRKIFYLKFAGLNNGPSALAFQEPTIDEVYKIREKLSDELAPYEDSQQ